MLILDLTRQYEDLNDGVAELNSSLVNGKLFRSTVWHISKSLRDCVGWLRSRIVSRQCLNEVLGNSEHLRCTYRAGARKTPQY